MCTAIKFSDSKGEMYFGRNLDWSESYGQKVVISPRGYKYTSAFMGEMSGPAVIGMAVVTDNIPLYFDCANEYGLAVAGLNFPGYTGYEQAPVAGKTNVTVYEFPFWVALNFKTVDEVAQALPGVAIVAKPVNSKYSSSDTHWMISDNQRTIVVEYTAAGMEVYEDSVAVLANQPGYKWHQENLRNYMNLSPKMPQSVDWGKASLVPFGGGSLMRGLPGDYYSPSRFVRATYLNTHYPVQDNETANVARLFHTLSGVAMIDGASAMASGGFERTIYTGGYSAATKTYYYNTYEDPTIVSVAMKDYDLDAKELIKI